MNSVTRTAKFSIGQPAAEVFPLFSPEGEKRWVPGWDYVNIMGSHELHEDYVFVTKNHDHAGTEAVWLVKRHEPENFLVQFYRIEPEDKVGVVSVRCSQIEKELTEVEVTYRYIALGMKGREFVGGSTSSLYEGFIDEWRRLLVSYFDSHR
jgi:hypothetical protein